MTAATEKEFGLAVAEKLKSLRKSHRYSQFQVSQYLGISRSTYTYYESGHTSPSLYTLYRLAHFYATSITAFLPEDTQTK